jgi:muconolactone delta-isomerase
VTATTPAHVAPEAFEALKSFEREPAQALQRSGKWRHLWRVFGKYENVSVFDVADGGELHALLVDQIGADTAAGRSDYDAIVDATGRRARPVILTALAAVPAFILLTFSTFWAPLAYVLIGGVAVGTVLTLIFVPALYAWSRNVVVPGKASGPGPTGAAAATPQGA